MTVGDEVDPRSAAYLAASAKIPPAAQGAFNLNLSRQVGTPTMVSMPLASFEKIAAHFERLEVHPPSYTVVKPTEEFGHRFHRWDKEDEQAQAAFDASQDLLQDVGLDFPDYAGFFFGQVTMTLATYQEMAQRISANHRDGRKFVPDNDQQARVQLINMKVYGSPDGQITAAPFQCAIVPLGSLEHLVAQAAGSTPALDQENGEAKTEPEVDVNPDWWPTEGMESETGVSRETLPPMSLSAVAMVCAHGYAICVQCDHVPSSWMLRP